MFDTNLVFSGIILFVTAQLAFAGDLITNDWGSISCGVQMSVKLNDTQDQIITNQSVNVSVRIKNISTNSVRLFVERLHPPVRFDIISPSGKDLSTGYPTSRLGNPTSYSSFHIEPDTIRELNYNLSSICKLAEAGTYKIVARGNIGSSCEAVSNPLEFSTPVPLTNVVYNPPLPRSAGGR